MGGAVPVRRLELVADAAIRCKRQRFFSADLLPEEATFDPSAHGHWGRQVGMDPLVTLFIRAQQ